MIEKITDHNLERYDSRLKEWCDRKFFEKGNYGKYQTTEEASAVAFYPAPNTPLEGKVKFSFTETLPVSGDKSPTNPSTITGVSNVTVTRCGKNLANSDGINVLPNRGITAEQNADGSVHVSGTTSGNGYIYLGNNPTTTTHIGGVEPGKTYTVSLATSYENCTVEFFSVLSGNSPGSPVLIVQPNSIGTVTINALADRSFVRIAIPSGNVTNFDAYVQIEEGSTAMAFEPYAGTDYTISLSDTYYGGKIDLATGLMTVTHEIGVITSQTSISTTSTEGTFRTGNIFSPATDSQTACSHFSVVQGSPTSTSLLDGQCALRSDGLVMFRVAGITELEAFKSWIYDQYNNGSPVTLAYKLANPTTVQFTPTQILSLSQIDKYTPRLNTVYTDADSIQISYFKSPIRDEYEKTQAILSLGGNS